MLNDKRKRLATIRLRNMAQLVGLIAVCIVIDDGNIRCCIWLIGNHCLHDAAFQNDNQPFAGRTGFACIRTRPDCPKRRLISLIQITPVDATASGLTTPVGPVPADRNVEGVVEMILDATGNYAEPLTEERLFAWHASLFPTGRSGMTRIRVGGWHDDSDNPMQVVTGPIGREKVHYEAPPAERVPDEMAKFLRWFEQPGDMDPLLIAGLAHLWFVTVHPFDDGNGRIARAIADMALARSEKSGQRFYSMSAQIRREHKDYYDTLEWTQKGVLDVTRWQDWFLNCLGRAIDGAQETLGAVLDKARFWERFATEVLNERQIKVLNRLLDGIDGKLTTSKWAKLAKCSQDTAYRDILDLIERGALQKDPGGGRSTSYSLVTK